MSSAALTIVERKTEGSRRKTTFCDPERPSVGYAVESNDTDARP